MPDTASSPEPSSRQRRARAAQLMASAPGRAELDWADLLQLPAWALAPEADVDNLAWATGAWLYADELKRCIDGRALALMRSRLGEAAFTALMSAPASAFAQTHDIPALALADLPAPQLDELLLANGRDWLLASIDSAAMRLRLRELWWPCTQARPTSIRKHVVARAVVVTAWAHHAAQRGLAA